MLTSKIIITIAVVILFAILWVVGHAMFDAHYWHTHKLDNFPFTYKGKKFWYSRSVAACCFIFKKVGNTIFALVERRGDGAADYQDHHCVICGYLSFDETLEDCVAREAMEECGFAIDKSRLRFLSLNSSPSQNRQNVSAHYAYVANENEDFDLKNAIGGETNEIADVNWYPIAKINEDGTIDEESVMSTCKDMKWAFNHDNLIKQYLPTICFTKN